MAAQVPQYRLETALQASKAGARQTGGGKRGRRRSIDNGGRGTRTRTHEERESSHSSRVSRRSAAGHLLAPPSSPSTSAKAHEEVHAWARLAMKPKVGQRDEAPEKPFPEGGQQERVRQSSRRAAVEEQQQQQGGEDRRLERKRLASQHQRDVKRQRLAEKEIQLRKLSERQERQYRVVATTRGRFTTVSIQDDEDPDAVDRGFSLTLPYPFEDKRAVSQKRVLSLLEYLVRSRLVL